MKLFKAVVLAGVAMASGLSRDRRSTTAISLTGEENPDQLLDYITSVTKGDTDDIEAMIEQLMGVDRTTSELQMRKFRHLKLLVLWLQKEQKFGRYCYYGCYCLPEGSHDISSGGYGKPMDDIDRACRDFKWCYQCLIREHNEAQPNNSWGGVDECRGEDIGYRADLIEEDDGSHSITCTNKEGSCRKNICECDKRLAEQLAKYEETWDESLHSVKGGFKRDQNCYKGSGSGNPVVDCCGDLKTFPFNQPRHENQCCDGPFSKAQGQC